MNSTKTFPGNKCDNCSTTYICYGVVMEWWILPCGKRVCRKCMEKGVEVGTKAVGTTG